MTYTQEQLNGVVRDMQTDAKLHDDSRIEEIQSLERDYINHTKRIEFLEKELESLEYDLKTMTEERDDLLQFKPDPNKSPAEIYAQMDAAIWPPHKKK